MGWECRGNRTYYYRGRRDGGRVVKEYVGAGPAAALIAQYDALDRDRRTTADLAALDAALAPLDQAADLVARVALLAAGYRQHKRGPWRKRRARPAEAAPPAGPATEGRRAGLGG